jgi:hypothetical protein
LQHRRWKPILLDFFCQQLRRMGALAMTANAGGTGALRQHHVDLGRRAQRKHLKAVRMARHHVERAGANRAGGAQNRAALLRPEISRDTSIMASGKRWQQGVHPVEHAAMAGQQPAAVLHARRCA